MENLPESSGSGTVEQILVRHADRINEVFSETGNMAMTFGILRKEIQELNRMSGATFKGQAKMMLRFYGRLQAAELEVVRLRELNNRLNTEMLNNPVKQNPERELNKKSNVVVKQKLSLVKQNDQVKQKLNIAGWSVQESGGFYRAFKRISGRLQAVYLGKDLTGAEQKIEAAEQRLSAAGVKA